MSYIDEFPYRMCSNHTFDQERWIKNIRQTLEEEIEDDFVHVSICNVPQTLKTLSMNAYIPQLVALSPYHYWRPELQDMERYKLLSLRRAINQNQNRNIGFYMIVDRLVLLESRIRACYHRDLDINGEALAWMMAINAWFLLEVINAISIKEGRVLTQVSSTISRLNGYANRKLAQDAILRDIFMLENQIPLFVLKEVMRFQHSSIDLAENRLVSILRGLYEDISPIKNDSLRIDSLNYQHILDLFYQTLVPKLNESIEIESIVDEEEKEERNHACNCLASLRKGIERCPLDFIFKLPLIFVCNFPGFTILKSFLDSKQSDKIDLNSDNKSNSNQSHSPLVEEIMIPSIVELSNSGVMFFPTNGDIMTINFDIKTRNFYLPTISLDLNSEILLRNLVAYEASMVLGPLVFARYIELMNGMIDTQDDVKLLRERGIVLNYLKSDEDVANLWNGMTKSIRITRVAFLDEVIKNVNEYYQGNWKVRTRKFVRANATNSWHFVTIVVGIMLLSLIAFQVFCSFFYCSRTRRS